MNKKSFGFTLIELLVVIAVLGVLAAAVVAAINPLGKIQQARDVNRRSDLRQIANALEAYFITNGSYPSTGGAVWAEGKCTYSTGWTIKPDYSWANAYIPNLAPQELKVLPGDPNVNGITARCYIYLSDGTWYVLAAHNGIEGSVQDSDPMKRLLAPGCTSTQNTFNIRSDGARCW